MKRTKGRSRPVRPRASVRAVISRDASERPGLESASGIGEEHYRDLVENLNDLVCSHDLDGRILFANRASVELLGYTCAELQQKNIRDILAPHMRDQFPEYLAEIRQNGTASGFMLVETRDGKRRVWEYRNLLRRAEGSPPVVHGVARDVTEQRHTESALRDKEQLLRESQAITHIGSWKWHPGAERIQWTDETYRIYGVDSDTFVPTIESLISLVHPEDREGMREWISACAAGAQPGELEFRAIRPDGAIRMLCGRGALGPATNGSRSYMVGTVQDITDRKRAEERARENALRLQLAAHAGNVGLWDWHPHTGEVHFSREWKGQLGYAEDEIADDFAEWQSRVHPDDLERTLQAVHEYLQRPWPDYKVEFRMRHKDGSYRWILAQASVFLDAGGQAVRMMGSHIDVTDRKNAEIALRESERKFSMLFERYPLPAALSRLPDGIIVEINEAFQTMLGYSREEVIGRTSLELGIYSSEARERMIAEIRKEGALRDHELRVRTKSGTQLEVLINTNLVEIGGTQHALVTVRDVTERRRAEAALRESERLMRLVTESVPAMIAYFDRDFVCRFANTAFCAFHCISPAEALGRTLREITGEDTYRVISPSLHEVRKGKPVVLQREERTATGEVRHIEIHRVPNITPEGGFAGYYAMLLDITERKRAEERLRDYAARQRHLLRQLMDVQEGERRNLSRELHDSVGQNLSVLGLAIGTACAQIPARTESAVRRLQDAQLLLESTSRQVRNVMADLRPTVLEDYGLYAALCNHARLVAERTGLKISASGSHLEHRPPLAVEIALFRIAQEALNNSVKHAHANAVHVTLESDDAHVMLTVGDDGVGFSIERLAPGVPHWGMAIMRERAESIEATLDVHSAPGKGTEIAVDYRMPR